jgi:hypothetical protein
MFVAVLRYDLENSLDCVLFFWLCIRYDYADYRLKHLLYVKVGVMVFNTTFNSISVIS